MGLRADISTGNGAVFSEDVLKIEVQGPHEDYLTIIDAPGIFRTTTQGTTKDDMVMVKDLVKRYIRDDRTIILAVLPSNVDIATQEILELAEDYDKNGERTLGVLTKPDLVSEPCAQAAVCDLIWGKKRPLTLGYFLIRNRGASSSSKEQPEFDPIFDQDELRLITHIINITDVFSADFQQGAHSRDFENLDLSISPAASEMANDCDCEETPVGLMIDNLRALLEKARVDDLEPGELAELGDVIVPLPPHRTPMPREGFSAWINDVYLQSRGLDLGTFNANLVSTAFAEQSRKWGDMTKIYMSRVIITLHRFIAAALRSICPEEQTRGQLWSAILESLVERYKMAMAQASLLIQVEQRKKPYTLNRQFSEALSKARGYRVTELLRPKARKDTRQYGGLQYMVNLDDIAKAAEGKSNVEQLQEEIHDILHAYYHLALDRFIDNVFQLAVDYYLLHGPSSPVKVFTQDWVINLESEQLERIVGETKSAKKRRSKLAKKIEDLSNALKILKT